MRPCACAMLASVLALAACAGEIRVADYDRACDVDEDCVVVAEGNKCDLEACGCANAAISVAELERYERDLENLTCPRIGPQDDVQCICAGVVPACSEGACVAERIPPTVLTLLNAI